MDYRLALDMGTNSIGWAVIRLNNGVPAELVRIGSRIFPDGRHPKTGDSLSSQRRLPRSQRRGRDRFLQRQRAFLKYLKKFGLFPEDEAQAKALQKLCPYTLRASGLDKPLTAFELGRALFHLNQRRGFKSNRKADAGDGESGKIKTAIKAFREELGATARTAGELLYQRLQNGEGTRARLRGQGAKASYDFYISRDMIGEEFDMLWQAQKPHHPELLTDKAHRVLRSILLEQRPLKSPPVGKCTLLPNEDRAPRALPSAQRLRYTQEVNHLRVLPLDDVVDRALTHTERDTALALLEGKEKVKYADLRKAIFGKENAHAFIFTIEQSSLGRATLAGNTTSYRLSRPKAFGKAWLTLTAGEQDAIVEKLLEEEDEQALLLWLKDNYGLSESNARTVANTRLEDGHQRLGRTATARVLDALTNGWNTDRDAPLTYDKAVRAAGFADHRIPDSDTVLPQLPFYGELIGHHCQEIPSSGDPGVKIHGRITNPTVHIALNQLRKVINALIKKYGHPNEIHLELARELKLSRQQKAERNKQNRENRERNAALNDELRKLGQKPNAENRLRLKLFRELGPMNHRCIYSGELIKPSRLFTNDYQIDHILPFSKTLDDGYNNKVLVTRQANADKGNRSLYELVTQVPGYDWESMVQRAQVLPYHKRKRFTETALQDWAARFGEFEKDGQGFLQRQLTDTAYLARVSRQYLTAICPSNKIICLPGTLTALLRGKWGLNNILSHDNRKNRHDHRHHAIDAAVIGVIDRRMLQKVASRAAHAENTHPDNLLKGIHDDLPWAAYRDELDKLAGRMVVSHKVDHNPQAQLHNDTAYGIVDGPDDKGVYLVRHRVELTSLKKPDDIDSLESGRLQAKLKQLTDGLSGKDFTEQLAKLATRRDIPRKVVKLERLSGITVPLTGTALSPDPDRRPAVPAKFYKGDSNYCYEIFVGDNGKWDGQIISTFMANQKRYQEFMHDKKRFRHTAFCGRPLVMRLIADDCIRVDEDDVPRLYRVQRISEGMITLCGTADSNVDSRNRDKDDPYKFTYKSPSALQKISGRAVRIDVLGKAIPR